VLIATCGLPGSGKSRLAHSVQAPFEAVLINSDATRKQLCGIAPEQPAGDAAYTADMTAATYRRMGEHAERALDRGRSVILDAGHRRRAQRAAVTRLAAERGVPLCWLEPEVDDATIRERLARRVRSPTQASDADLGVYESLLRSYQRPEEIPAALLCRVVPDTPPRDIRARVIDALIGGAGPAA
jgi:predicted kinase